METPQLKQCVVFSERQNDSEVSIYISSNCPLGFAHDVLYKARNFVVSKIIEAQNSDKPKEEFAQVPPDFPPTELATG